MMTRTHSFAALRRRTVVGATVLALTGVCGCPTAAADPSNAPDRPANCTAADFAGIASGVAAATSAYLFTHPDVNDFFTDLHGRSRNDMPAAVRDFFDAHPQEHTELVGIRQPITDFRERCGYTESIEGQE